MSDDFSLSVTAVIKAERTSLRKLPRVTLTVHLTFRGGDVSATFSVTSVN